MLFNSLIFIFGFLPVTLLAVYISPSRIRNLLILLLSIVFYAWGGVSHTAILIGSIIGNYLSGIGMNTANLKKRKLALTIGIVFNLSLLVFFKYINFFVENVNYLLTGMGSQALEWKKVKLPIGISFFTFQAISYLVDVYRRHTQPQRSLLRLGLFISLFPQLVAGPIVRYNTIEEQLRERSIDLNKIFTGIKRFLLGLGKKVILADSFAYTADKLFSMPHDIMNPGDAWLGILLYTLQIYYDFSGYSDMAIGLGKMMGFELPENFNFPYISQSIKEFWRRWHMTLSQWFKDYLYIPLGGNRLSSAITYRNLIIVFFLTGLWHGASWNFVIWGLFHGFFLVIERIGLQRWLNAVPAIFRHIYVLLVVMLAWVLFRAGSLDGAIGYYKAMLNLGVEKRAWAHTLLMLDNQLITCLIIGLLGAFPFFPYIGKLLSKASGRPWQVIVSLSEYVMYVLLFFLTVLFVISTTHQPFIYFQF